ncbi:MAG: glycerol-3-phosphate 1-O-acyltransferase [Deltaproteobacteria bacterium]|nr:glycerol-3-phosphate 1-O-acyltransferase [Deltaproteobacteria bacterium]
MPGDLAGPEWPATALGQRVVFLVEAASRIERRLVLDWIERSCPRDVGRAAAAPDGGRGEGGGGSGRAGGWQVVSIPCSRRQRPDRLGLKRRAPDPALEAALATEGDPLMAPLRVVWLAPLRGGSRETSFFDLLVRGDPRDPNWLRQAIVSRREPDRCLIVAGEPATASNLRARWTEVCGFDQTETIGFADFVRQKATLALERAERRVRGARYKVPRLVHEAILGRPGFRGGLDRIARSRDDARPGTRSSARAIARITAEAARDLREIAATHSPLVIDLVNQAIRWLYTRGYDEKLAYDEAMMKRIARLEERHPVVFLPTHKSNLDHLVLQYALHEHGLPPNHTAGGINMNFFPVGALVRRSGVFFIRRSFREDAVYKHVLAHYIDYLVEKRFPLEWYIEGGRSRSGKLLPPRYGLLANVVDAWRRGKSEDVYLVPVSIAYDQIQEVGSYVAEQRGADKERESFAWLVRIVRQLKRRYGRIYLAFGEPVSMRQQLGDRDAAAGDGATGGTTSSRADRRFDLEKLAFEVSVRINRVTPITPTSLATLALLGATGEALSVREVQASLESLLESVAIRGLPTTDDFRLLESEAGIRATLDALVDNDVLTRFDEGIEPVYNIGDDQQLAAAYYRNTIVHFFVNRAIAELALLHAAEGPREEVLERFWAEVMRLRDLLKFEFFFPEKEVFREEIRQELEHTAPRWEARLASGELDAEVLVRRSRPFSAHRALRPFLESYRVVADQLVRLDPKQPFDEKRFLALCIGVGRQYKLQKRIHAADSISKILFQTALRLARNRDLFDESEAGGPAARLAFATEIHDVLRRVDIIVALAASRRAGFRARVLPEAKET